MSSLSSRNKSFCDLKFAANISTSLSAFFVAFANRATTSSFSFLASRARSSSFPISFSSVFSHPFQLLRTHLSCRPFCSRASFTSRSNATATRSSDDVSSFVVIADATKVSHADNDPSHNSATDAIDRDTVALAERFRSSKSSFTSSSFTSFTSSRRRVFFARL